LLVAKRSEHFCYNDELEQACDNCFNYYINKIPAHCWRSAGEKWIF